MAWWAALGALAVFAAADHVQWALSCTAPIARGDAPRHALYAVSWARRELAGPSPLGLAVLLDRTYYPGLTTWLALPLLKISPSGATFRAFLGLFSGVLVLGTGLLAGRTWGRAAGLAAAALSLAVPLLWTLRPEVMLDGPLAAMVALFLATLPVGAPRGRGGMALTCGVVLGLGLLTKQTMPYVALPALAAVGLGPAWRAGWWVLGSILFAGAAAVGLYLQGDGWPAVGLATAVGAVIVGLAWLRRADPAWSRLLDLGVVVVVALAIAGTWYARSVQPILGGLVVTRQAHADVPLPSGAGGLLRIASMWSYVLGDLLPAPVAWLLLLGLALLPWSLRGRPLMGASLAALVGGEALISTFPDLHARHYAPLVAPLLLVAVSPLGLLGSASRWRRSSAVAAAGALVVGGLVFALAWHLPGVGSPRFRVGRANERIPQGVVASDLSGLAARLLRPPANRALLSWPPDDSILPLDQAVAAIEAHRAALPGDPTGTLLSSDPEIEAAGMLLAIEEQGFGRLRAIAPWTAEDLAALATEGGPVYRLELLGSRWRAGRSPDPDEADSTELLRIPGRLPPPRGPVVLVVRAWDGALTSGERPSRSR